MRARIGGALLVTLVVLDVTGLHGALVVLACAALNRARGIRE